MFLQLTNSIKQALYSIKSNKLRSILTMLGMIIGVASVIVLLAAGKGSQSLVLARVQGLGSNIIFIQAGGSGSQRGGVPGASFGGTTKTLTMADLTALKDKELAPSVKSASGYTSTIRNTFKINDTDQVSVNTQGRDTAYFSQRNFTLEEGSLWTEEDEKALNAVAVLGSNAKTNLFPDTTESVIGKKIKIKGQSFEIIGVLQATGSSLGGSSDDDGILVPLQTAQKLLLGVNYLQGIQVEATTADSVPFAQGEIEALLRSKHEIAADKNDDFTLRTQQETLDTLSSITEVQTLFLAAIAAISLVVGGIGIMNIMLVVVTERTKEIGLRKAIGASRQDVLLQFLIESVVVTIFGGSIGILIGLVGSYIVSNFGGWAFSIDFESIGLAFGVSAVFGVIFGLYPANKASKLDPIDALRYE